MKSVKDMPVVQVRAFAGLVVVGCLEPYYRLVEERVPNPTSSRTHRMRLDLFLFFIASDKCSIQTLKLDTFDGSD
jgi:hypothetical protein